MKCTDAVESLKQTEAKLYEQRFEHAKAQYDGILQGYDHTANMLNEYISQSEEQGYIVSKKYYDALIKNEKSNIDTLKKEQTELIAQRDASVASGKITKGSQAWVDMCAKIDDVTQAIEEGKTTLIEYSNAIRDIDWQVFDLIQERISDVTSEADFLIELMSDEKLFDDNGKMTDKGLATMGLHGQNYNTYMYQADEYKKEIAELDRQLKSDPYDQELVNRRRDILELQRESILNAEQEKQAIKDLVEEGINLELDALQERIDLHNEELDSMRDLYDYQKNVQKQSEEIAALEKQRAAYLNDDSAESQAKLQEITVSLKEAKENLQETEFDRYISQQSALLDSLYEEYELILNQRLDNVDALLSDMIVEINASATTISNTLTAEATNVGTTLSEAMSNIWSDEGKAKSVIVEYGKGFQDKQTTTNLTLDNIKANVGRMVDDVDKDAEKKTEEPQTRPSSVADPTKGNSGNKGNNNNGNKTSNKSEQDYYGVALAIWNGNYGWGTGATRKKKLKEKGFDPNKMQSIVNKLGKDGFVPSGAWQGKYYGIKSLPPYHYNKFAVGAKKIDETQLAWTQEKGKEFIVRPSDGAILTPIARGDSILTSAASNNIWDMANSPAEFIKDNLNLGATNMPNNSTVQSNYTQHFDKVIFNMPNVKNYGELLLEMKRDPNFEKLIHAMTLDQVAGKSSLSKNKAIR